MHNTKPTLGPAGISANIEHYEALVAQSYNQWQRHLAELEYWSTEFDQYREQHVEKLRSWIADLDKVSEHQST